MSFVNGALAGHHAAAKHALGVLVALFFVEAFGAVEVADFQEVGPVFGLVAGQDSVDQGLGAAGRGIERDHFDQRGQAFLDRQRAGRSFGQPGGHALPGAVEAGAHVDPAFVHFEQIDFALRKHCPALDLHVVGAGGGVGQDAVVELDVHLVVGKVGPEARVEPLDRLVGRERLGIRHAHIGLADAGQDLVQRQAQLADRGVVAGKPILGAAVKLARDFIEPGRAPGFEHFHAEAIFARVAQQDRANRVVSAERLLDIALDVAEFLLLGLGGKGQLAALVVLGRDRRQLLAARGKELRLDRVVPLDRFADADRALGFDQAARQLPHFFFVRGPGLRRHPVDSPS